MSEREPGGRCRWQPAGPPGLPRGRNRPSRKLSILREDHCICESHPQWRLHSTRGGRVRHAPCARTRQRDIRQFSRLLWQAGRNRGSLYHSVQTEHCNRIRNSPLPPPSARLFVFAPRRGRITSKFQDHRSAGNHFEITLRKDIDRGSGFWSPYKRKSPTKSRT